MKLHRVVPGLSTVGGALLLATLATTGCVTAKRAIPAATLRSGCGSEAETVPIAVRHKVGFKESDEEDSSQKVEVVSQDGHDAILNVCGVHEKWHWSPLDGWEYVSPAATQPPPAADKADGDGDGVPDATDACPAVAGMFSPDASLNGCPPPQDADGDGIADPKDACKDVKGVANADPAKNGCPADTDGDGVADEQDACKDVAGVANADPAKNGCPADTDGDGVPDAEDACADKAGPKTDDPKTNGCPLDKDGDGTLDADDACPDEAGPVKGCPDRDEDGVADKDDRCPDKKGKVREGSQWNGCPGG
ncbi:MAG: thrombospondin type 3 repeat-containing protein [Deltaproteobacteria bacterium]|jgi:hypothetical protein|nr:thrombospondin type 3 repeat-containing protein [Deltaproteobacteria bacterium]MBW2530685.1 thrombospondin type 3 repeat-containing protein [Deltaproteobacteria bacterium]